MLCPYPETGQSFKTYIQYKMLSNKNTTIVDHGTLLQKQGLLIWKQMIYILFSIIVER